jgi:hypothetical protein
MESSMLKLFVATLCTQGEVPGDFCFVPEGELVGRYSMVCDLEKADGSGCGCGRAFAGFVTHTGTTTAMVVERDMTELEWRAQLFGTLCDTGWGTEMHADDLAKVVDDLVAHDLGTAAKLPAGQVVGRRAWNTRATTLDYMTLRKLGATAARGAA